MVAGEARSLNQYIQGARGLSALLVFAFHIWRADLPNFETLRSSMLAVVPETFEYGVDLFFCISGFVIAGALMRGRSPGKFLVDRAIRIYPVLWPPLFVSLAHGLLFRHGEFATVSDTIIFISLPANLLALPGVADMFIIHPVAWSLSYEMAFYVFCAVALLLGTRLGKSRAAILWMPVSAVLLICYPRALFFVVGFAAATWPLAGGVAAKRLSAWPILMIGIMFAACSAIQRMSEPVHLTQTTLVQWASDWRLPLAGLAVVASWLAIRGIADGTGLLGRLLTWGPMLALGTISYSFYLWHVPAIALGKRAVLALHLDQLAGYGSQLVLLAIALPFSVLLAWASFQLIEKRLCNWLRDCLRSRDGQRTSSQSGPPRLKAAVRR